MRSWIQSHEVTFVQGELEGSLCCLHEDVQHAGGVAGLELTVRL